MGFRDVLLFIITAGTNLQWVATAAAGGASALVVWFIGFFAMALPLAICVIALSSRHPEEGGVYVWAKKAFGDFAGFLTGWTYWMSNLPYFPGVLYFAAANALYAGGSRWIGYSASAPYFIVASLIGLASGTVVNVVGVEVGKWLSNVGAIARWLATALLVVIGVAAWWKFGSATRFSGRALQPGTHLKDIIFWSTIAFALTGLESASFLGDEIRDARRTVPRAILVSLPIILVIYLAGTLSVLVAIPSSEVTNLQSIMQAVARAESRIGLAGISPLAGALIAVTALGSVGAWLASVARIPFVAGLDRFLPEGFGRLHPRWGTPWAALVVQAGVTAVFVFLGQAGTNVRGAYDAFVSMTIIWYFIPFLYLFAAAIKLRGEARVAGFRIPGGSPAVAILGVLGFLTTLGSIGLSLVPAEDNPSPALAIVKVLGLTLVMVGLGVVVYVRGRRRR
ncbi:MAG TPA: APC family permease [Thermoanaerobaculia bacterium]|nr:APC family permease [Thermoanaerobaculia bacterium]